MLHLFNWELKIIEDEKYIVNNYFWLKVDYNWEQKSGLFFLHPVIDDNQKTIRYFAFQDKTKKTMFLKLSKIKWIWQKMAFTVSSLSLDKLEEIVKDFDIKELEKLPWIWPKTAKRILIELKTTISKLEIKKINKNDKIIKDILWTLANMWYDKKNILSLLDKYNWEISKESMKEVIIRLMKQL